MLLDTIILQNSLLNWIYFLGIVIGALIGTRMLYWFIAKVVTFAVRKTKTRLDDLLVDALRRPVLIIMVLAGFWYGKRVLTMSETVLTIYNQIIEVAFMIAVSWFIVKFIDAVLENYLLPYTKKDTNRFDPTLFPLVKGVLNFVLYAIAIIFIIQHLGYEVTGLLAGLGIGGLAFALAAQDVLSNFFGGAAVISDKPFKVGDRIKMDSYDGFVKRIGIRSTQIETFDGTIIVLPNKTVASSVVENISAERARRVKLVLGVEYGTSSKKLHKAKELLKQLILDNTLTEDRSLVHFKGFGPSSLDLQLIYWIHDLDNILAAQDEVNFAIKEAFEKARIEFAFPSQTVYVKK